jgi:leucine dehydrogenase
MVYERIEKEVIVNLFKHLGEHGYGEIHCKRDQATGLQAIVAIHDARLGPALGGCRFIPYASEEHAFVDALRLARGMTYKAALAGLNHGGGKAVLMKPASKFSRTALFRSFGRFVEDLRGHYITAEDSGTSIEDMEVVRTVTKHVTGVDVAHGGSGDPSPFTALGVRRGIEACVKFALKRDSLEGLHVVVQGVGHVGYHLCRELHAAGARITVADVDPLKAERAEREFGATVADLNSIFDIECDIFSPCALGSALNYETIPRLRCKIVAGAANNQLENGSKGADLMQRGILYAPDYAINAGGLVNVAQEVVGYDAALARERTLKIFDTIYEIAERADKAETPTNLVANKLVEERLARAQQNS